MNRDGDLLEQALQAARWPAIAAAFRVSGDLQVAEDAVQEACAAAVQRWAGGVPANPVAWLAATARHKALDHVRREAMRTVKELAAVQSLSQQSPSLTAAEQHPHEQLALILMCCHPAFDTATRTALTLRSVCGLSTREIAAVLLLPEPTVAKRLVRARRKIRESGLRFAAPDAATLAARLGDALAVLALLYTEGHRSVTGPHLVRPHLCAQAIAVARILAQLLPVQPEVLGLLALLLLTDARNAARTDTDGNVVLLAVQDRSRYDRVSVAEGEELLERALRLSRPGPWQLQAAIAACHSTAPSAEQTDWREIAALYSELLRYDPNPVHEANRAIAVAEAEDPAAGLVIIDAVLHHPQLARWPTLHAARADLLRRLHRTADAQQAYAYALDLAPGPAEQRFLQQQLSQLDPKQATPRSDPQ